MGAKDDLIDYLRHNPVFDASLVTGVAMGQPPKEDAHGEVGQFPEEIDNAPKDMGHPPEEKPEGVPVVFLESVADCELEAIKKVLDGIAPGVVVLRTGRFVALQVPPKNSISPYAPARYNVPRNLAGTLGAVVKTPIGEFVLSSNHVLACNGRAPLGTPIVVPGTLDDPSGSNPVGSLAHYVDMEPVQWPVWNPRIASTPNDVDCALAAVTSAAAVQSGPRFDLFGGGSLNGLSVTKSGRTTAVTNGKVCIWDCATLVDFDFGTCFFDNMFATFGRHPFAAPGDSGAVAMTPVTATSSLGVGLVTARAYSFDPFGPFRGYFVLMCPLNSVADAFALQMNVKTTDLQFFPVV